MVERSPKLVRSLEGTQARLKAETVAVVRADALAWLQATPATAHDLILLDPPYHEQWLERLLPRLRQWLAPDGRIYAECEFAVTDAWLATCGVTGLAVIRAGQAGQVHYHLLGAS
jgi:16S rRNA G966 N2-methylase RsmD